MTAPISVLHVDDEPGLAEAVGASLERHHDRFDVHTESSPDDGLAVLADHDIDCIVSENEMPSRTGLDLLEAVREARPELPFILYTGNGSEEVASTAMTKGVTDYLQKEKVDGQYEALADAIETAVSQFRAEGQAATQGPDTSETDPRNLRQVATDSAPLDEPGELLSGFIGNLPGLAYRSASEPPWEMSRLRGRVERLTGYQPSAFEQGEVTFGSLVVEDDLDDLTRNVQAAVDTHRQFTASYRIQSKAGDVKHVFERGVPVVEDGAVTALEGIIIDLSQRKASKREPEHQNELFAHTQQMAAVGGWELDPQTGALRWTDQVNRIHGFPLETSPTVEEAFEFYHPEDRPVIREAVEAALRDGEPFDQELRIITARDDQRWVHVEGVPEVEDGDVVRLQGAVQDVTERREREQSLREEQALTRSIFEALPDVLYMVDEEGRFKRWNDELLRVSGYSDAEIGSMEPLDFVHEADRGCIGANIQTVLQQRDSSSTQARLQTNDGELIPYEFTGAPLLNEDGAMEGIVGIGRDVSGRKQRQRRFEAVFNNTYQFTGLLDPDGTMLEANDTALEFGDLDPEEAIGEKMRDVDWFQRSKETRETAREAVSRAADGEFVRQELAVQGADEEAVIDFSIRPITDDDGEVIFLVPEGRDITRLKNRERLLRVLHRLLRHNIRNDLTTIRGYAETLAAKVSDEDHRRYAERIDEAARDLLTTGETAKKMVDLILDPTDETKRLDLGEVVEGVGAEMRERYPEASITVTVEASVAVACDARIEAVFEQLVENGIEHNPAAEPRVDVRVSERAGKVCVEIADNGPGMTDEEWAMVDEEVRDESTQLQHASGMGLLLARWTVDAFGGSVEYSNGDSDGCIVTVRFPGE